MFMTIYYIHLLFVRSGYQLFSTELLKQLEDIPVNNRMSEIGMRWKVLSEDDRRMYNNQRQKLKVNYEAELASFSKVNKKYKYLIISLDFYIN